MTDYKCRNGLSKMSLPTIFGFLTVKLIAVTAPMLRPQTVSFSTFRYLYASRSTISASADSLMP